MNRIYTLRCLFLYLSALWLSASGQTQSFNENDFVLYNVKDGLTNNHITGLAQDPYGYLWIATQKGLNRYDGNSFMQFYSDSTRNSLPIDFLRQIKWLDREQLGVITSGLHIVNSKTLQQRNIVVSPGTLNQPRIENNTQGMVGDVEGNIFLLSSSGFYHFNGKDELVFRYDHYKKEDARKAYVPFGRSDGIIMPQPGLLLLATTAGTYIYNIALKDFHVVGEKDNILYQQIDPEKKRVHFMHNNDYSFSIVREQATELAWFDLVRKKKYPINTTLTGLNGLFGWRSKITHINDSTFTVTGNNKGFYLMQYNKAKDEYRILPEVYLPNYLCRVVFLDKQNRIWIGTDRGLLRQKQHTAGLEKINLPLEENLLGRPVGISSMYVVNDKLFVGTFGAGVYIFDRNSFQFLKRLDFSTVRGSDSANNVNTLLALNNDSIYVGTIGPLIGIHTKDYSFRAIHLQDWDYDHDWVSWQHLSSGKTWYVTTSKNNLFYYRRKNEKSFTLADYSSSPLFNVLTPMYITEDPKGNIWFGGHGASRFNIRTQRFDLLMDSFPKTKTARKEIRGMAFDKTGKIYFAIAESGLDIYNPALKTFEHITRNHGLPDNDIRALYLYNNKLWMGTESGLANYDTQTQKISSFGLSDNMPEGGVTAYSFFYDSIHNQLYAGFNNTFVRFNPNQLSKSNLPPEFFIESIEVAGSSVIHHPTGKLDLSYKNNSYVINLSSVNFEDAHQQQFAYRLIKEGNEPWVEIGTQRSIIFSNLAPEKYNMQVKVYVKNNSWSPQIKELAIEIKPPFWHKAWFIGLSSLLFATGIWAAFRTRVMNIRRKAKINAQITELEMKGLHAQMNPHFIFNCLNSIREMILHNENKAASHFLGKFAGLIRSALHQSQKPFVTLRETMEHLTRYIEMEQIRNEEFTCRILVDDELEPDEVTLPSMLIQPLVENALWHGTTASRKNININIDFMKRNDQLLCIVEDDGIGINRSLQQKAKSNNAHQSTGIKNAYDRIQLLNEKYRLHSSISISDKTELEMYTGTGTVVQITLPLQIPMP